MLDGNTKVLVVGIDGGTFDLIKPWIKEGNLPHMKDFIENGIYGELESTIPMFTPTAWSSFLTGKNPGKHGILGFFERKKTDYSLSILKPHYKRGKVIWDYLSENDKKSIMINVPTTYPPQPLKGIMLTGLMTPPEKNYIFPQSLRKEIEKISDYLIYPYHNYVEGEEISYIDEVFKITESKYKISEYLIKSKDWDFFTIVFSGSDFLQHALWKFLNKKNDKSKKIIKRLVDYYNYIDEIIFDLYKKSGENTILMIVSDHGFGKLDKFVHINSWLIKNHYINFKNHPIVKIKYLLYRLGFTADNFYKIITKLKILNIRNKFGREKIHNILQKLFLSFKDINWEKTKAYSLGSMGQIYVNKHGRESKGIVTDEEYYILREEIKNKLLSFHDNGKPVFNKIFFKEELYSGKFMSEMPDIITYTNEGYVGFEEFEIASNNILTQPKNISGTHRINGIFIAYSKVMKKKGKIDGLKIIDILPTILTLLNIPISNDIDGKVMPNYFTKEEG